VLLLHLALHLQPARAQAKAEAWDAAAAAGDPLYAGLLPLAPALAAWHTLARRLGWPRGLADTRAPLQWPPPAGEAAVRAACAALNAAWGLPPPAPERATLAWLRALLRQVTTARARARVHCLRRIGLCGPGVRGVCVCTCARSVWAPGWAAPPPATCWCGPESWRRTRTGSARPRRWRPSARAALDSHVDFVLHSFQ